MAITQEQATQISGPLASPPVLNGTNEDHGRVRIKRFTFTQGAALGDAGSLAEIVKLPAGDVRVLLTQSLVAHSALGAARTIDMGWLAYTDTDGDAVVADPNGLDDGVDGSSAGSYAPIGTVGGDETFLFRSNGGVTLTLQVNDADLPAGATFTGYVLYVID